MQKRRPRHTPGRGGIRVPALVCLLGAVVLLLYAKAGGEVSMRALVGRLAANERFVLSALALETGVVPNGEAAAASASAIHSPFAARAGSEDILPGEDEISESGFAPTEADAATEITSGTNSTKVTINNATTLGYDINSMLAAPQKLRASGSAPQVMIVHTHSTEAYTPDEANPYAPSETDRTLDTRYNVVRVGDEMTRALESRGIKTVHCREIFDNPAYSGAYDRSLAAIEKQLKETPSIQVVIDVHRDSMIAADGTEYKTACEIDGKKMAQLMLVVGSNAGGLKHDNWQLNLNYAVNLQSRIAAEYPSLMRSVNLRKQRFNQSARSPGSMLVEVGSSGNTLTEAIDAATIFANCLADDLLGT